MKKAIVAIVSVLICFCSSMWAGSSQYYGQLKTQVASSSSGKGKVYASKTNTEGTYSATSSTAEAQSSDTENGTATSYAFAQPNDGNIFSGWSQTDGGSIVSTDNPYAVSVVCSSSDKNSPTLTTLFANFVSEDATVGVIFKAVENGSYTVVSGDVTFSVGEEEVEKVLLAADNCLLTATPSEGYKFWGWYTLKNGEKSYLSKTSPFSARFLDGEMVYAEFVEKDTPLFLLDGRYYSDLNEAVSAAGSGTSTIVLVEDGTIYGETTIPNNVTLLVPYNEAATLHAGAPGTSSSYSTPSLFRRLTLASGSRVEVLGAICVNALQLTSSANTDGSGCGGLTGMYGCLRLEEGSTITLKNGSKFYAYGIVEGPGVSEGRKEGSGTIVAEDGASVFENFTITDWKGGTIASKMRGNSNKVFLFNQYFIQSIQVPIVLNCGATESVYTSITASSMNTTADAKIIGSSDALFTLSQGAQICKWYDGLNDRLHIETDGTLNMEGISVNVGVSINTKDYVMPLTNNMSVSIHSGTVTITSDVELLPGAEMVVAEGAELAVKSGAALYVYDIDDWGTYVYQGKYVQPLRSVPNRVNSLLGHTTDKSYMRDAILKVDGEITVNGSLFTTSSGAEISSSKAGRVHLSNSVGTTGTTTYGFVSYSSSVTYGAISDVPAMLKNADGSYLATAGSSAGTTYYYGRVRGTWSTEEETYVRGDVNLDGSVDVSDVTLLVAIILGSEEKSVTSDVNADGAVDVSDVTALVGIILNK